MSTENERCKHGKMSDNPCFECDEERGEPNPPTSPMKPKCEWLYNYRGYRCAAVAKWQTMCLLEDGTLKNWKLCDTHKTEVGTVLERLIK